MIDLQWISCLNETESNRYDRNSSTAICTYHVHDQILLCGEAHHCYTLSHSADIIHT
jgi:hypothetical protein